MGPKFRLTMWDTHTVGEYGKARLGYRLVMWREGGKRTVLFDGEDYFCSPCAAIDSDAAVESLMSFLTLRPGDTDSEYFERYTDAQRDYCAAHAEALSMEVQARFCDENGNVKKGRR